MLELSPNERAAVALYELQTFIIEQSVRPKESLDGMTFDMFMHYIMACVRIEPNLWIKSSEQYKRLII